MIPLFLLFLQDADAVLAEMDKKGAEIRTLVAHYEQVKHLSLLDDKTTTCGILSFRRENRALRWDEKDTGTIQQIDTDRYVAVYPRLKEAEIFTLDQRGKHLAAVMGAPDLSKVLQEDFEISVESRDHADFELRLVPRTEEVRKRVREARLRVSRETYLVTGASYVEPNGDSVEIAFRDARVNQPIDPKTFDVDLEKLRAQNYTIRKH